MPGPTLLRSHRPRFSTRKTASDAQERRLLAIESNKRGEGGRLATHALNAMTSVSVRTCASSARIAARSVASTTTASPDAVPSALVTLAIAA